MMSDDDVREKGMAFCRPISAAVSTTLEDQLLASFVAGHKLGYEAGLKAGYEAGASHQRAVTEAFLRGEIKTPPPVRDEALQPGAITRAGAPMAPALDSLVKEEDGESSRKFALDIVRKAHPQPVPSLTILKALRARDNKARSARRDDVFYKAMRRLRNEGKIVQTKEGYVLPGETAGK